MPCAPGQTIKHPFRTNLDAEIIVLPGRSLASVQGLFAHLESFALRRKKASPKGSRKGGPGKLPVLPPSGASRRVSFRELGRQVIGTAKAQVEALQSRLHEIQSLVLINNWPVAERLWSEFLPDCKTPLFELDFLEELWGINAEQMEGGRWSLTRQWHQFVLIQADVEILLARQRGLVELSDTLERDLGRWLKRFSDILEKLDEASAA